MFFLAQYSKSFGKRVETVSRDTMARLVAYDWPGNIRELQNVIERAVVLAPGAALVAPSAVALDFDAAAEDAAPEFPINGKAAFIAHDLSNEVPRVRNARTKMFVTNTSPSNTSPAAQAC